MTALNKQAPRMRNYLDMALKSGVKLVHLTTDELSGLLDEVEKEKGYSSAYEAEKWHYHGLAESEGERADRAEKALEAAENRIAELEARTVTLPEPFKMAKSSSGLTYYYADEVDAAIQAAGIGVKGE
ncbi:hypothetical protein HAX39_25430 [Citrobacter freundii]|nr:hypothetical protein [Citrobacter freundii]